MTVTEEATMPIPGPQMPASGPAAPDADADAPWGRKADGSPRAKPGVKPGGPTAGPRKASAPGPRKATGAASKKANSAAPDYRMAIIGLGQLPIGVASMAARLVRDDRKRMAIQLDAMTVKVHLPAVAEAVNSVAQDNAKVAAALDRIVSVGPYGEVIAAVAPILLQCMVNHGAMEPNPAMGLLSPDELIAAATA
jgi:hypothetical protein